MNRKPVVSSHIQSIGYDIEQSILEVEFKDGSIYHYLEVPVEEYEGFMAASSHGTYLAKNIKDRYKYGKIN